MEKPKVNLIAIALIIVVISGLGYMGYQFKRDRDIKESIAALERIKADTAQILGNTATITNADFIEIGTGWSYDRVKSTFRGEGKELSRVDIKGAPLTIIYQWTNADSSNALITFQDGAVVSKAQAGLK